jgi:sirohydrochlorin ferrochelatase
MQDIAPRLLLVAHGTASPAGSATTEALLTEIAAARRHVHVGLCFLDVAQPRLPEVLDTAPTVLVPLLLSTGYHVQSDIPAAVAGFRAVRVARHLGPHPLLADALADRLAAAADGTGATAGGTTALVGAGSSRPEAAAELAETGRLLGRRLGSGVAVLTITPQLRARLAGLDGPVRVATYLLAEGQFLDSLQAAAAGLGPVAEPLGVHPALVELAWLRYDEACDAGG